jgi:hypothetical protein
VSCSNKSWALSSLLEAWNLGAACPIETGSSTVKTSMQSKNFRNIEVTIILTNYCSLKRLTAFLCVDNPAQLLPSGGTTQHFEAANVQGVNHIAQQMDLFLRWGWSFHDTGGYSKLKSCVRLDFFDCNPGM